MSTLRSRHPVYAHVIDVDFKIGTRNIALLHIKRKTTFNIISHATLKDRTRWPDTLRIFARVTDHKSYHRYATISFSRLGSCAMEPRCYIYTNPVLFMVYKENSRQFLNWKFRAPRLMLGLISSFPTDRVVFDDVAVNHSNLQPCMQVN